jgi:hypothetical protein
MRGDERFQVEMFSCVTLEQRVQQDYPPCEVRRIADVVLRSLSGAFVSLYSASGRHSIESVYAQKMGLATLLVSSPNNLVPQIIEQTEVSQKASCEGLVVLQHLRKVPGCEWVYLKPFMNQQCKSA